MRDALYPDGIECRKCERVTKHHRLAKRKAYSCQECATHVYPLAGTIFEKSRTPLKSWLYAMYLMASTRCGISAKQLERELGVTYKTAWRMFKQIRSLMDEDTGSFFGEAEIDETYVGGKGYKHSHVTHAEKVYVVGNVHTNTIEGFWSLVKRGIGGVYHSVSEKHIQSYINEYAFRYNHRDDDCALFETVGERAKMVRAGQHGKYAPIG